MLPSVRRRAPFVSAVLALLLHAVTPLHAYAAFESVQSPEPVWLSPRLEAQPNGDVIYRLVRAGSQVWIELRNRGPSAADVAWSLPGYAVPGTVVRCQLPPGGRARQAVPVVRLDQGLMAAQVAMPERAQSTAVEAPVPAEQVSLAYGVVATTEDARFAAHLLSYALGADAEGRIDAHLRWEGDRPVHADWRIVGRPDLVLPRLHLLPGQTEEIILPIAAFPGLNMAIVEVWRVRIGSDHGPTCVDDVAAPPAALLTRDGWLPCASGLPNQPGWNANVVHFQAISAGDGRWTGVRLWNRSPQALVLRCGSLSAPQRAAVELAGGAETTVELASTDLPAGTVRWIMASAERIAGQPLPAPWTGPSPLAPEGGQAVVPLVADARFNPHQVITAAQRTADGGVEIVVVNRLACRLDAVIALAGTRATLNLEPGASQTVALPGLRFAPALATAPVQIAGVRLDGGEPWCGSFD